MTSVLQEVLEVNKMSIEALRKKYKELFNAEAPLTASRRQLIPKITYQLQVLNGIHYSSLAKIARFITGGTNWNVQRFFKLSETAQ